MECVGLQINLEVFRFGQPDQVRSRRGSSIGGVALKKQALRSGIRDALKRIARQEFNESAPLSHCWYTLFLFY